GEAREALSAERLRHGIAVALRLAVVRQLEIGVACERSGAAVLDADLHIDHVVVTAEGIDLLDLQPVLALRAQAHLKRVDAGAERARARIGLPEAAVVGAAFAGDATLRFV